MAMMECPALGVESWGSATSVQWFVSEEGMAADSLNTMIQSRECSFVLFLTDIEDEGVAESIVPIVATVDQELCVCEDGAAVPAVTHEGK